MAIEALNRCHEKDKEDQDGVENSGNKKKYTDQLVNDW